MSEDLFDELEAADRACREAQAAIEEIGEERLDRLADAHGRLTELLRRYEDSATGSGQETFKSFVAFQGELSEFEDELEDDLPERDAIEDACDALDRRRLNEGDFERARETLAPVEALLDRLDERAAAHERYREARRAARTRIREIGEEIDDLESTLAFADVDLDASVAPVREPIAAYDDAVDEAFREFKHDASARAVLSVFEAAAGYPLVPVPEPPADLARYLRETPAGEEPIRTLLEYADYSRSKLTHYVDDPGSFGVNVAANRTYLERLDAEPFRIDWPPPPADALRFRTRELVPVVDRFAPDDVVARLHEVRDLLSEPSSYEELREVARAREALSDAKRERLKSGAVERELVALRDERERLHEALQDYPDR